MLEKRRTEQKICSWIEEERERLLFRVEEAEGFPAVFYLQCVESTAADAYEVFMETPLIYNYFRENRERVERETVCRFFKLAAIHHTIRVVRRRRKELDWEPMAEGMISFYGLTAREQELAELLHRCAEAYPSGFQELFVKTTVRYLFADRVLNGFSFAFIGNFWYNSYSSFMGSFTGYVPFHIRLKRAQ